MATYLRLALKNCTLEYEVYVKCRKGSMKLEKLLVCLYVDDLLIPGSSEVEIAIFKKQMMNEFEMSDLGLLSNFLGIEFEMTRYGMVMHQTKYAKDLLKRFNMQQSNPVGTLVEVGLCLKKETNEEQVDPTHYRRIVRCLRYLCNTRSDLNFSVRLVSRLTAKAFSLISCKENIEDRKSIARYIFFYGRAPISWSSTKELVVALSSCEVEYIVASETACQVEKNSKKVKLLVDNKSVIDLARHPPSHERSKHIETRFDFLREQVSNEKLQIENCITEIQFANIFTKALKRERFGCLIDSIGIVCVNAALN
ncbi:Copia protein, partial [Mucuna pruriens]